MAKRQLPPIPAHVRITAKRTYEVLHTDDFKDDPEQVGECRYNPPQIVLKRGQSNSEEFSTLVHEICHAASNEADINLTEKQVCKLERALVRILKLNGWV